MIFRLLLIVAFVVSLAAIARAGFDEGMAAYNQGDYVTVLKEFRPLAEQGNADAQHILGVVYGNGWGVTRDYATAARWFRAAAEQGHPKAQYDLGLMYSEGWGVTQDYAVAMKWFRKAAKQRNAHAQSRLGQMYVNGLGVPQDFEEAVKWLQEAARQGDEYASKMLGWSCAFGHKRLEREIEQGIAPIDGQRRATDPAAQDASSQETVFFEAVQIRACEFLAEEGIAHGAITLAAIYQHGVGAPKDPIRSLMWFDIGLQISTWSERTQMGWREQRNEFASTLNPDQIAEAERMAREWLDQHRN